MLTSLLTNRYDGETTTPMNISYSLYICIYIYLCCFLHTSIIIHIKLGVSLSASHSSKKFSTMRQRQCEYQQLQGARENISSSKGRIIFWIFFSTRKVDGEYSHVLHLSWPFTKRRFGVAPSTFTMGGSIIIYILCMFVVIFLCSWIGTLFCGGKCATCWMVEFSNLFWNGKS